MSKYKNILETEEGKEPAELDFGSTLLKSHEEHLVVYEGIQSETVNTRRFNENSALSMTYLGRSDKERNDKLKAEE